MKLPSIMRSCLIFQESSLPAQSLTSFYTTRIQLTELRIVTKYQSDWVWHCSFWSCLVKRFKFKKSGEDFIYRIECSSTQLIGEAVGRLWRCLYASLTMEQFDFYYDFLSVLLSWHKRTKRSSQSDPSARVMILSLRVHVPEYPHKITPANAGPAYFDWLTPH